MPVADMERRRLEAILFGKILSWTHSLHLNFGQLLTENRAASAVAVTIPSCWYLLANRPDTSSHGDHGDHGDAHGKSHGKEHKESKDEPEEKTEEAEEKDSQKSESSDSEDDSKDVSCFVSNH
jgi:hypothetical protein